MKRLKGIFLSLVLLVCCVPMLFAFSSCEEDAPVNVISVSLNHNSYTMAAGVSFKLTANVFPSQATNKKVLFSSDNEAVATVDSKGNVLAVSAGTAIISAITQQGSKQANCTVTVIPDLIQLSAPTQLVYDGNTLSWDPVVILGDEGYAVSYQLMINGVAQESSTVKTTYSTFTTGVKYVVQIRAKGDKIKYADSDYSVSAEFTKLPTPAVSGASRQNGKIVFDAVKDQMGNAATDYTLVVKRNNAELTPGELAIFNAVSFEITATSVTYEIPQGIEAGEYTFAFRAVGDGTINLYDSDVSVNVVITKLARPANAQIVAGELTWKNVVGAAGYLVELSSTYSATTTVVLGANVLSYTIPSQYIADNATFEARVQALGDGITTLDSVIGGACATERLAEPSIIGVANLLLSWQPVPNATHYGVKVGNDDVEEVVGTQFDLSGKIVVGNNIVRVLAYGDGTHYVASNYSTSLTIRKLGQPSNFKISNGQIVWDIDYYAQGYVIYINEMPLNLDGDTRSYALDYYLDNLSNKIVFAAGNYTVKLKSVGNGSTIVDSEVFTLKDSSGIDMTVIKLAEPSNLRIEDGEIYWDSMADASEFMIEIDNNGTVSEHIVPNARYYINTLLESFQEGVYSFKVRALGGVAPYVNGNYTSTSLVATKYAAPYNLRVEDGVLKWDADSIGGVFPTHFAISINNSVFVTEERQLPITSINQTLIPLTIRVQSRYVDALGMDSILRLNSNYSVAYTAIKLSRPTNVKVVEGVFTWNPVLDTMGNQIERYKVYIDYSVIGLEVSYDVYSTSFVVPTSSLAAGEHSIRVYACGNMDTLLNSDLSESVAFAVLNSPSVFVTGGMLMWSPVEYTYEGVTKYATSYVVYARNTQAANVLPTAIYSISNTNFCSLESLSAGTWYVSVMALGNNSVTFSSPFPTALEELTVKKLTSPSTGFASLGNSVVWSVSDLDASNYDVQISKKQDDGTSAHYDTKRIENATTYQFPDNYLGGLYQIRIRAVGDESTLITSNWSATYLVRRLTSVSGLAVVSEEVSWSQTTNASGYSILINGVRGNDIENYSVYIDDITRTIDLRSGTISDINGLLSVQLIANYDYSTPIMEGGVPVYLVSSAPSAVLYVYRYLAPTLQVSNGLLTWINSYANVVDVGFELKFEAQDYTSLVSVASFSKGSRSYDLSTHDSFTPVVGTNYLVSIRALGNGAQYITSNWSAIYGLPIVKLAKPVYGALTGYTVINGKLTWTHVTDATSYEINVSTTGRSYTDNIVYDGSTTITYLPSGNGGQYRVSIRALGDNSRCISSDPTLEREFSKLDTPTSFRVESGEIEWYARNSIGDRVAQITGESSYLAIDGRATGFRVVVGEYSFDISLNDKFIMSQHSQFAGGAYIVQVVMLGNSWETGMQDSALALTSSSTQQMNVVLASKIVDLDVVGGELVWDRASTGVTYNLAWSYYDLLTNLISGVNEIVNGVSSLRFLEPVHTDGSAISYALSVNCKGTVYGDRNSSFTLVLNSEYSDILSNIKKLPQPEEFGIKDGAIAWDFGNIYSNYDPMYTANVGVYVNQNKVASVTNAIGSFVLDSTFKAMDDEGNFIYYDYNIQALGDEDNYISSELYEDKGAYKMPEIQAINIGSESLYVTWSEDEEIIMPDEVPIDKYIVRYKISQKASGAGDDAGFAEKVISSRKLPFWTLGTYALEISSSNSSDLAFRSDPIGISNLEFYKFESGDGSADQPFVISNKDAYNNTVAGSELTRFNYIKHIPSCFFKLGQDITLPTASSRNFTSIGSETEPFTGGLNGDGYTVYDYTVDSQAKAALFNYVNGGYLSGFSEASPGPDEFGGRFGIVMNLNMDNVSITGVGGAIVAAGLVAENNGFIDGCVVAGSVSYVATSVSFSYGAGIAVYNGVSGVITNCINDMTINISCNNPITFVGGIVARNLGLIEQCKNRGALTSNFTGGIVSSNEISENNDRGLIRACVNAQGANITGIAYVVSGAETFESHGQAGGLAAINAADILLSYNGANVVSRNTTGNPNFIVWVGGLVGENKASATIGNSYASGTVTRESSTYGYRGGLVGNNAAQLASITNCMFDKTVFNSEIALGSSETIIANVGKTTTEMKNGSVISGLNTGYTSTEGFYNNVGGYPILDWERY